MLFDSTATKVLVSLLYVTSGAYALSDECKNETEQIKNSTSFQNATASFDSATAGFIPLTTAVDVIKNETFPNPLPNGCSLKDSNITIVCVFDYAKYTSGLEQACEAEGGQVLLDEFKIVCQHESDRRSELTYLNYPTCWGGSCDADNITDAFEDALEEDEGTIEAEGGYNCLLLDKVNSGGFVAKSVLLSGAMLLLSSFAFI
eukprot:CAMPEP_0202499558 /NCGR_PEP_ID=MMETSP1361-20130828/30140_1 /ASSEMBLY_ACC=CAM_ASM_000849 /TAXON_ID=210615 /ORGANISM="Staurosira complex sp., Strain CCMP2646" /LENGTH=202 /DNA_ID=CAMNT_0049131777 /DNA_START=119 /DNA_END=727 /DNA_ORIENTATION=-